MVRFNGEEKNIETLVDIKGKGPYLGKSEASPFNGTGSSDEADTKIQATINVAGMTSYELMQK
jgi:hypothetical protein